MQSDQLEAGEVQTGKSRGHLGGLGYCCLLCKVIFVTHDDDDDAVNDNDDNDEVSDVDGHQGEPLHNWVPCHSRHRLRLPDQLWKSYPVYIMTMGR